MPLCQDLFNLSLTLQFVVTQTVISWTMFQELLLAAWLLNSQKWSHRTMMFMIYTSSMRTSPWRKMRGRTCSEKLFSLLIFERSDAMLKIRRNQELTMRISSIVYQNKYRIPSWDFEGSWSLPKSSFWRASFRVETCTCQQCCNRIWQDTACLWIDEHPLEFSNDTQVS